MSKTQTYPSDLTDEQWQLIRPLLPKRKMGTLGLLLAVIVTPANVQDYDGAKLVFDHIGRRFPRLKTIYADSIYVCNGLVTWLLCRWLRFLEIVKRPPGSKGFVVVAKRWIVE